MNLPVKTFKSDIDHNWYIIDSDNEAILLVVRKPVRWMHDEPEKRIAEATVELLNSTIAFSRPTP